MRKFIHLIPYDGIGGVETAARSMGALKHENIDFDVDYIYKNIKAGKREFSTFNPFMLFAAAWRIQSLSANVLIVSLWRSAIVGLIAKILDPKIKLVTFLHSDKDVHLIDYFFTRVSLLFSIEIWADSAATIAGRLRGKQFDRCRLISFVLRKIEVQPAIKVEPSFIYWGRINQHKALDRALRIFAQIRSKRADARFWIVGPDGGALLALKDLCMTLDLADSVIFKGAATFDQIVSYARQASFYLQTSLYEGMAMSVVESMQLGLVPIVTPVGEISSYCQNGINAVLVDSDEKVVEDILNLLESDDQYLSLRANAVATWKDRMLYRDSMLEACKLLLADDASLLGGAS